MKSDGDTMMDVQSRTIQTIRNVRPTYNDTRKPPFTNSTDEVLLSAATV